VCPCGAVSSPAGSGGGRVYISACAQAVQQVVEGEGVYKCLCTSSPAGSGGGRMYISACAQALIHTLPLHYLLDC